MRNKVIEALVEQSLDGPYAVRQILKGGHPNNRKRFLQRDQPKFVKGIYKGQYFRVKLPQKNPDFPPLPSYFPVLFPPEMRLLSSKFAFETLFPLSGSEENLLRRLLKWCRVNWPAIMLHVGSLFTLMAFTRTDVLELRSLSGVGFVTNAIFRYTQKPVLWSSIAWPAIFAFVNGVKIVDILHEQNAKIYMSDEHERIYVKYFLAHGVTPRQFERIEKSVQVMTCDKGDALIQEGDPLDQIYLVVEGSTQAHIMGRHLPAQSTSADAKLDQMGGDSGAWVGEMTFLEQLGDKQRQMTARTQIEQQYGSDDKQPDGKTTEIAEPDKNALTPFENSKQKVDTDQITPPKTAFALYTIMATENCVVWKWSFQEMESLMSSSLDLRGALTRAMTASIVGKVVNLTLNRKETMPTWSTWLADRVRDDGAKMQVQIIDPSPEDCQGAQESGSEGGPVAHIEQQ